jgi:hypothetical protein
MVKIVTKAHVPVMSLTLQSAPVGSETIDDPGRGIANSRFPAPETA